MQDTHLYLSMIPEALVASMLPAEAFGRHLAVSSNKRFNGPAIYFEIGPDFTSDFFKMDIVDKRCVTKADGTPKNSVYLGIYRVLEHIPLSTLGKLYLTTRDGQVLELDKEDIPATSDIGPYLYDEICPVHPLIASSLDPSAFTNFTTNPSSPLYVPKVFFAQLDAEAIMATASDNSTPPLNDLPHRIKDSFKELETANKPTKTVDRIRQLTCRWSHIKTGYFIGDQDDLLYYPLPSKAELDRDHYKWWRSATI